MKFDYNQYRWNNCFLPLIVTTVFGIGTALYLRKLYGQVLLFYAGQLSGTVVFSKLFFGIIPDLFILRIVSYSLFHGGIYLRNENEVEALTTHGTIDAITELGNYLGYGYVLDNEKVRGGLIHVNGKKYTVMDLEKLYEGETVGFTYLPKSCYVLTIWNSDSETVKEAVKNHHAD